jgi:hypothetical protein
MRDEIRNADLTPAAINDSGGSKSVLNPCISSDKLTIVVENPAHRLRLRKPCPQHRFVRAPRWAPQAVDAGHGTVNAIFQDGDGGPGRGMGRVDVPGRQPVI